MQGHRQLFITSEAANLNASWQAKAPIREERAEIGQVALTKLAFSAFQKPNPKKSTGGFLKKNGVLVFESKTKKMSKSNQYPFYM